MNAKKLLALILTVCMLLGTLSAGSLAQGETFVPLEEASGIEWFFSEAEGVLVLRGSGAMPVFDESRPAPWDGFRAKVRRIILMDGITAVSPGAFRDCAGLESVSFPVSIEEIAHDAFEGCGKVAEVEFAGDRAALDAIIAENDVEELMDALAREEVPREETEAEVEALQAAAEASEAPKEAPTEAPTAEPTAAPTATPTPLPVLPETEAPTAEPTATPTQLIP